MEKNDANLSGDRVALKTKPRDKMAVGWELKGVVDRKSMDGFGYTGGIEKGLRMVPGKGGKKEYEGGVWGGV